MWLKYDSKPIDLATFEPVAQTEEPSAYSKPRGCWITDDTDQCWRSWCLSENFALDGLTHKHQVTLDEGKVLILRSAAEVESFAKSYRYIRTWGLAGRYKDICIDWPEVAKQYSGVIITPYQWSLRLHDGFSWYYGWDCASGCIWEPSAIREIKLIEIDPEVAKACEAA